MTHAMIKRMLTIAIANTDFDLDLIMNGRSNGAIKVTECTINIKAKSRKKIALGK